MMTRGLNLSSMIIATMLFTNAAARIAFAVTIDDFSDGSIVLTKTTSSTVTSHQTGLNPAAVLGGGRNIAVGEFGEIGQSMTIDALAGEMRFHTPSGGHGYFQIDYGTASEPLNFDLTADGANAFLMHFAFNPPLGSFPGRPFAYPPNSLRVVTSTGTAFADLVGAAVTTTVLPDGSYLARIPFSAFGNQVDLSAVNRVEFEMFRLSSQTSLLLFATVPEPATSWLLVAAVLITRGDFIRRRRAPAAFPSAAAR
jgi:hypothetical protein